MYICMECHEKDKHTIQCKDDFFDHQSVAWVDWCCDICGKKSNVVAYCDAYIYLKRKEKGNVK